MRRTHAAAEVPGGAEILGQRWLTAVCSVLFRLCAVEAVVLVVVVLLFSWSSEFAARLT